MSGSSFESSEDYENGTLFSRLQFISLKATQADVPRVDELPVPFKHTFRPFTVLIVPFPALRVPFPVFRVPFLAQHAVALQFTNRALLGWGHEKLPNRDLTNQKVTESIVHAQNCPFLASVSQNIRLHGSVKPVNNEIVFDSRFFIEVPLANYVVVNVAAGYLEYEML